MFSALRDVLSNSISAITSSSSTPNESVGNSSQRPLSTSSVLEKKEDKLPTSPPPEPDDESVVCEHSPKQPQPALKNEAQTDELDLSKWK